MSDGLKEFSEAELSRFASQTDFFIASFVLTAKNEMRYITSANCVTSNDNEDARVGKESRCNCLFLGRLAAEGVRWRRRSPPSYSKGKTARKRGPARGIKANRSVRDSDSGYSPDSP